MLAGPPVCRITPGSAISAKMNAALAHHVVVPDRPDQLLLVLDPVLQRDHRRVRTDQRPQPGRGGVGVEALHAEQHDVARPDLSRVIGGRRPDRKVALHAAHPQHTAIPARTRTADMLGRDTVR
jgi:hypothetical protein